MKPHKMCVLSAMTLNWQGDFKKIAAISPIVCSVKYKTLSSYSNFDLGAMVA